MDNAKRATTITEEEVLRELEEKFAYKQTIPEGALTVKQLAKLLNRSPSGTLRIMQKMESENVYRKEQIVFDGKVINIYFKIDDS